MSHQAISFVKSIIRITGYFLLPIATPIAILTLIISEVIGIIEEVGQA